MGNIILYAFKIFVQITLLSWALSIASCKGKNDYQTAFPPNLVIDTIPFSSEPASNLILLEALVHGKSYKFTFDSGSPTTLINTNIMSKRVSPDTIFFNDILFQPHPSFRVLIDTLQIGRLKVLHMDSYLQRELNLDGLLGDDIIGKLVWKFDLINRKMYVTEDVRNFSLTGKSIPFQRRGEHIFISGTFEGIELELIVDTGFSGFITIDKKYMDPIASSGKEPIFWQGISTRQTGNPYASSSFLPHVDSTYYLTGNLNIGGIRLEGEIIELRNFPLNIIGMDFFKRFDHFILDYPNSMIHFGEGMNKSLDFLIASLMKMNTKGVTFIPSSSKAQIGRITPWAREKGINYLDTVLSIDGIAVVNRDSIFYQNKSGINEETKYYEYRPSKFLQLWNDFHFIKDTSVIEVKRGDSSQFYTLFRQYSFTAMPDSLHDYYVDLSLPLPTINRVKTESDTYYFKFKTDELLPRGLKRR